MQKPDAVHVFDKGKANLNFHYGLAFTLYNDTVAGGTSIDTEGADASGCVKASSQGGLLRATIRRGVRLRLSVPNGVNILILRTQYFITYERVADKIWSLTSMGLCNINFPMGIIAAACQSFVGNHQWAGHSSV